MPGYQRTRRLSKGRVRLTGYITHYYPENMITALQLNQGTAKKAETSADSPEIRTGGASSGGSRERDAWWTGDTTRVAPDKRTQRA
jgi:hypothetical protein